MRLDTDVQLITDPKRKRMKTLRRKKTVKKEFGIKAFLRNLTSSNGTFSIFPITQHTNSFYQKEEKPEPPPPKPAPKRATKRKTSMSETKEPSRKRQRKSPKQLPLLPLLTEPLPAIVNSINEWIPKDNADDNEIHSRKLILKMDDAHERFARCNTWT